MKYVKNFQKQKKIKTGTPATRVRIMEEVFSLCPSYSIKQLNKINTIQSKKIKQGQRKILSVIFPIRKQIIIKDAFNPGGNTIIKTNGGELIV
jgi:hypothetical protein